MTRFSTIRYSLVILVLSCGFLLKISLVFAHSWHLVNSHLNLDTVAVGSDGTTWGLVEQKIYRYVEDKWIPIKGKLMQIAVGNADHIWGVNAQGDIYRWTQSDWQPIWGQLQQIAVGNDGVVWGIDIHNRIYRLVNNPYLSQIDWLPVEGKLAQIAVGNIHHIWGVDLEDQVYQLTAEGWQLRGKDFQQVAVGADGTVWGIKTDHQVVEYQGNQQWSKIDGNLTHISIGDAQSIWGINHHGQLFRLGPSITEYHALQQQLATTQQQLNEARRQIQSWQYETVVMQTQNRALGTQLKELLIKYRNLLEQNQQRSSGSS